MYFSELRAYTYGDDVRHIDWNVTARTDEPHIKVFEEEREQTLMLCVDISPSGFFGSRSQTKMELAIRSVPSWPSAPSKMEIRWAWFCSATVLRRSFPQKKDELTFSG